MRTKSSKNSNLQKIQLITCKNGSRKQENQGFREATVEMKEGMSGPDRASSKGVQSDR